jgi:hypothetical protein
MIESQTVGGLGMHFEISRKTVNTYQKIEQQSFQMRMP